MSKGVKGIVYDRYEHELEKEVMAGPMPKHIAVIMDGNRRFAEDAGSDINEGHKAGKKKLMEVSDWCIQCGIRYVTVYAFSTENFSRDNDEVDFLMDLASESFREMADHDLVTRNRVRIKAIGLIDDLPDKVVEAIRYAEERTRDYSDYTMTVCIAYGGRQEIVDAMRQIAREVKDGVLDPDDITEDVISSHMYD